MRDYTLITFGCQMNQHDSLRMGEVLGDAGFREVSDARAADAVILNTCSVREKAEQKLRSEVGRLGLLKRERPELIIGVAGCVAQQEGERLVKKMPQIDVVVGPDNIAELPALLRDAASGGPPQVRTVFDLDEPRFLRARPTAASGPTAFVTIMKGCDERCSFCIVPTTRGSERYRPSSQVLDECRRLVDAGVKEVTLLGQTVDSYLDPEGRLPKPEGDAPERHGAQARRDESQFPFLLRAIADQVPGLERLRYTSPHPRHLTPSLIAAHRDLPVLAKHVHMPVQSGSDRMLRRMLRRYSIEEYERRTTALRQAVPGMTLSTDVIVGFPGESRADFDATLALVERVQFVGVFGFKYSQRPGTPALKLADDISEEEKAARLEALFESSESIRARHLEGLVGTTQRVLIEGLGKGASFTGRTNRNEIVHVACNADPTGSLVDLRIRRAFKHSLEAEPLELRGPVRSEPARRALPVV